MRSSRNVVVDTQSGVFCSGDLTQQRHGVGDSAASPRIVGIVSFVDQCLPVLPVLFHVKVGRSTRQIGSTDVTAITQLSPGQR